MDYRELAAEFVQKMYIINKYKPHRKISESMQGEMFVLHFLAFQDGRALPSEISSSMKISSARVAAALNSLERKGFITRQIDTNDRRKILVTLTEEGKVMSEKHHQEVLDSISRMFAFLGEQDAKEYVRLYTRLAESSEWIKP